MWDVRVLRRILRHACALKQRSQNSLSRAGQDGVGSLFLLRRMNRLKWYVRLAPKQKKTPDPLGYLVAHIAAADVSDGVGGLDPRLLKAVLLRFFCVESRSMLGVLPSLPLSPLGTKSLIREVAIQLGCATEACRTGAKTAPRVAAQGVA